LTTAISTVKRERAAQPARTLRPSFAGAVRGEILKLVRMRATWVMVGFAALLFLIVLGAFASEPNARATLHDNPHGWFVLRLNVFTTVFNAGAGIFLLIAAARLVAMEYSSGTIRVLLGRGTGRLQLLGAKLLTLSITGITLLAVYLLASTAYIYATVVAWDGSISPIADLGTTWHDLGLNVVLALISIGINVLLGTTAAVLGRSLAFGLGAALAFFPADNFGTIVLSLLNRLTNQHIWNDVSAYLLGPNLNMLQPLLLPGQRAAFAEPLIKVDATHALVVVAIYAAIFLVVSMVLTARRDVLQ
jgi:ABC-type transport system involved in multi-copper enzyme maturation permease subunit